MVKEKVNIVNCIKKIIEEVINNKKKRIKKVKGQMLQEVHDKLRPKNRGLEI